MEAVEDTVMVNGAAIVPFGGGVIGDVMDRLTPPGAVAPTHDADNVTGELNPFMEVTEMSADPLSP